MGEKYSKNLLCDLSLAFIIRHIFVPVGAQLPIEFDDSCILLCNPTLHSLLEIGVPLHREAIFIPKNISIVVESFIQEPLIFNSPFLDALNFLRAQPLNTFHNLGFTK